jgi:hypothetical protein
LNKPHRFPNYRYAFDIASAVAVAWHGSSAPCGDEGGVVDYVPGLIGKFGQFCGQAG